MCQTALGPNGYFRIIGPHAHGKFFARREITDINLSVTGEQERLFVPARVPLASQAICINNFDQIATGRLIMRGAYYGRFRRWPIAATASLDRAARHSNQVLHKDVEKKSAHVRQDCNRWSVIRCGKYAYYYPHSRAFHSF
jgi:hypothetical protein